MNISFVFFGTDTFSTAVLDELAAAGFTPSLIVTAPDRKAGRGQQLTPPPVKLWAQEHAIPFLQPTTLKDKEFLHTLQSTDYTLGVLASYGKIIPQEIIDLPEKGILNVHPSLLPKWRGPSPLQAQILHEDNPAEVGVTIMLMDAKMDHGPILKSQRLDVRSKSEWPMHAVELGDILAHAGGKLLAEFIPKWIAGDITATVQNHEKATFCKMIKKEDGLVDESDTSRHAFLKFLAYTPWPGVYFLKNDKRVKITDASFEGGCFVIKKVIPEGKKEISYEAFAGHKRF